MAREQRVNRDTSEDRPEEQRVFTAGSPTEETEYEAPKDETFEGYQSDVEGKVLGDQVGDAQVVVARPGEVVISRVGNQKAGVSPQDEPDAKFDVNKAQEQSLQEAALVGNVSDPSALTDAERQARNVEHYNIRVNHDMNDLTGYLTRVATIEG